MAQQLEMSAFATLPWFGEGGLFARSRPVTGAGPAVPIRLDANSGVHLLGDDIIHLDPTGARTGSTPIPVSPDGVLDFSCDTKGLTLLLVRDIDAGVPQLMLLNPDGTVGWSQTAAGNAEGLRFRGGPVAFVTDVYGRVTEIDMVTGDVRQLIALRDGAGRVFDAGDLLVFVYLDERSDLRGVSAVGAAGEPGWALAATEPLNEWLAEPIGADGQGRLYVWHDGLVARLSADGVPQIVGIPPTVVLGVPPDAWQVDLSGMVLAAVSGAKGVTVFRLSKPSD